MKENKEKDKDYKIFSAVLLGALTAGLILFMIFGIAGINLDKDIKKADLLVEEKNYAAAINIYDKVLRDKNLPEVKEKRDKVLELMNPKEKLEYEANNKQNEEPKKETLAEDDLEDSKDEDKDLAQEDEEKEDESISQEDQAENEDENEEANDSLNLDLPSKTVWAARANIRSGPSENSSVIGVITKDTEVYIEDEQVESSKRTWYKVVTMLNGQKVEGWMASNTLNN